MSCLDTGVPDETALILEGEALGNKTLPAADIPYNAGWVIVVNLTHQTTPSPPPN